MQDRGQGTGLGERVHRWGIPMGMLPTWPQRPSRGCPEPGGIVQEPRVWFNSGVTQEARSLMQMEESSFVPTVGASPRAAGGGERQPELTARRGVSEGPSRAEGRVRAGRMRRRRGATS